MDVLQKILDAAAAAADGTTAQAAAEKALADLGYTSSQVADLRAEAVEKFETLYKNKPRAGAELDTIELLSDVIVATKTETARIEANDAAADAALAAMADRVREAGEVDPAAPVADPEAPEGDPAPVAEVVPAAAPAEPAAPAVVETPAAPAAPEPVLTASAPRQTVRLADVARTTPTPVRGEEVVESPSGRLVITAAAEVRDIPAGSELKGSAGLARAAVAKFQSMPSHAVPGLRMQSPIAAMRTEYPPELTAASRGDDTNVIEFAANQARLKSVETGEVGLVAAGGWCSPSDTSYELAPDLSSDSAGLIDVPDIATPHGGLKTPNTPDYSQVFATGGNVIGNIRSEAQENPANLGDYVEKPFYRIPCTTWTESRAGVVFTGIEAGILQDSAYPELGARHVELAIAIHRHKYNANTIAQMRAGSTVWDGTGFGPSATAGILNGVGFLSKHMQYLYRSDPNFMLEWIFPEFAKEIIRADYSLRSGIPFEQINDATIDAWFAARNARVQWVYDWQDAYTGGPIAGQGANDAPAKLAASFGSATAPTAYPAQIEALAYPAGTWVRGRGDVVNLEAVYDSVNIRKNDFLRLFMEEKLVVHKRAYRSFAAKFNTGVNGITSAPRNLANAGILV